MKKLALFLLFLSLVSTTLGQNKHTPTIDEQLSLKSINGQQISPDGRYVAYRVRETDWEGNQYIRQLWIVNVSTGSNFQLTRGKKSVEGFHWSPDSKWIAFTTEREQSAIEPPDKEKKDDSSAKKDEKKESEKTDTDKDKDKKDAKSGDKSGKPAAHQIWLVSPERGEAWQLTRHETDTQDFDWSKDGKQIAFTAAAIESKPDKDRKEKYSDYEVFEEDYKQSQIWTVDVAAAQTNFLPVKARQITKDEKLNVTSFSWSPDSTLIAYSVTANPFLSFRIDEDIYIADLAHDNAVHKVVALEGPDGGPIFSPDGKQLVFSTALASPYPFYTNSHIATVDVDKVLGRPATTPADVRDLIAKFDEDPRLIDWGPNGIYFTALQKTTGHLFRLDPSTAQITRIS
ncbi:MAG: PD40 domain-containing protein, partial [Acidobacteria bacterium]|nr:PD40 domain-containing protein [Acidobacteriota bacterium]